MMVEEWRSAGSASRRPRVLFVSGHPLWPVNSGGRRREFELLRRLAPLFDLHVVAVDKALAHDDIVRVPNASIPHVAFGTSLEPSGVTPLELTHDSPGAQAWLADRLARGAADLVHCEGAFLRRLLPADLDVPLVIGTQNVEWELGVQRARVAEAVGEAYMSEREIRRWKARDLEVLSLEAPIREWCDVRG